MQPSTAVRPVVHWDDVEEVVPMSRRQAALRPQAPRVHDLMTNNQRLLEKQRDSIQRLEDLHRKLAAATGEVEPPPYHREHRAHSQQLTQHHTPARSPLHRRVSTPIEKGPAYQGGKNEGVGVGDGGLSSVCKDIKDSMEGLKYHILTEPSLLYKREVSDEADLTTVQIRRLEERAAEAVHNPYDPEGRRGGAPTTAVAPFYGDVEAGEGGGWNAESVQRPIATPPRTQIEDVRRQVFRRYAT